MVPINSRQYLEQFTLVEPQQRQKCTSSGEPGRIHTGVLSGKNIANLNRKETNIPEGKNSTIVYLRSL